MGEVKHTPGPWRVLEYARNNNNRQGKADSAALEIVAGNTPVVSRRGLARPLKADGQANAALIAAAPEMFEALKRIAEAPAWGAPHSFDVTPDQVRQLARAALASAKGERV